MAENEVSVTGAGLVVKGEIVEDIRPVVRRMAKTADSVLRLFDNLVGIPLDYASNNFDDSGAAMQSASRKYPWSVARSHRCESVVRW